jgi:DNA-binding CsgD family transcriptional regulator
MSYVVAPIAPAGDVLGLVHADHGPNGRAVEDVERDVVWALAEGFGRIYERTDMRARVDAQLARLTSFADQVELLTSGRVGSALSQPSRGRGPQTPAHIAALLTPREREVLVTVVTGASNALVADRLLISTGTVKSHVNHILRKLGAANRSELIAMHTNRSPGAQDLRH